jgi:hypothetical protein
MRGSTKTPYVLQTCLSGCGLPGESVEHLRYSQYGEHVTPQSVIYDKFGCTR